MSNRDALEASLIDGGIPATAAKILSNAIGNANTGRTYQSRQTEDATPTQRMRMIDSNTRKYILTNLDSPSDHNLGERLNSTASQFHPRDLSHPYEGSQPATANPTLSTPSVKGGNYVKAGRKTDGEVAQAEVTLDIQEKQGEHARLNKSTGKVESVPISIEIEPKGILEGSVEETESGTVIKLRVVSSALRELKNKKLAFINQTNPLKIGRIAQYYQCGPNIAMVLVDEDNPHSLPIDHVGATDPAHPDGYGYHNG